MGNTRTQQIKQTAITATESTTLRTVFLILVNIREIKIKFLKSIDAICGSTNQWRRCNVGCQWTYRTLSGISPNPEWWGCGQYGATVQKHWKCRRALTAVCLGLRSLPPSQGTTCSTPSHQHPQYSSTLNDFVHFMQASTVHKYSPYSVYGLFVLQHSANS